MFFEIIFIVLSSLWLFLPAYLPNNFAVVFSGKIPIDFGKSFKGKRIFGDGKTWSGLIFGTFFAMLFGIIQMVFLLFFPIFPSFGTFENLNFLIVLFCLSFGSLFGDLIKSFFKRRLGYERGEKLPVLDQYDFVIGAFLFLFIFQRDWFLLNFYYGYKWIGIIAILILTPILHRVVNIIGYKKKYKKEPW